MAKAMKAVRTRGLGNRCGICKGRLTKANRAGRGAKHKRCGQAERRAENVATALGTKALNIIIKS